MVANARVRGRENEGVWVGFLWFNKLSNVVVEKMKPPPSRYLTGSQISIDVPTRCKTSPIVKKNRKKRQNSTNHDY